MYISRLILKSDERTTRMLRVNPYLLHQAVYQAFPDKENGGTGRVLYRQDTSRDDDTVILVQSEKPPDWPRATMLGNCLLESPDLKEFAPVFKSSQHLYFHLRANPIVKRRTPDLTDTRRQGLLRESNQVEWLNRKATASGFSIINCRVIPEGVVHDERGKETRGKIRHYAVRFEGMLSVTDPVLFLEALKRGIGPAKGFGFGLLSIAPVRS
jgi:CRISPR system Cascade subunit CasE